MTTLHLGVLDVPYTGGRRGTTTGDVAQILEDRYGVMNKFWQTRRQAVVDRLVASAVDAVEARLQRRAQRTNADSVLEQLRHEFRTFISQRQVEHAGLRGVPTKAALRGVSHRLKHPYAKRNPRRPSFRDTGLYEASFRAWID